MKVLIVDDVDYIRKSISKVLDDSGFVCTTCENGKVAISKVTEVSYDLIITDIMMPDTDGFEFLDFLREREEGKVKTPVLAISGGSKTINSDLALKMINEKADAVLQKPFAKAQLMTAIAKVIGQEKYSNVIAGIASNA